MDDYQVLFDDSKFTAAIVDANGHEHRAELSAGPQGFALATSNINGESIVKATECTNLELETFLAAATPGKARVAKRPASSVGGGERKRAYSKAYHKAIVLGKTKDEARAAGQAAVAAL